MPPTTFFLLLVSALTVFILAIGTGFGHDFRRKNSLRKDTHITGISGKFKAQDDSNLMTRNEITAECRQFYAKYDNNNCSVRYNEEECHYLQLPEESKLNNYEKAMLLAGRLRYPKVHRIFYCFRLRSKDAGIISRLLQRSNYSRRGFRFYATIIEQALDILETVHNDFCFIEDRLHSLNRNLVLDGNKSLDIRSIRNKYESLLYNDGSLPWDLLKKERDGDDIFNILEKVFDSFDILITNLENLPANGLDNTSNPYQRLCSEDKRFGLMLKETLGQHRLFTNYTQVNWNVSGEMIGETDSQNNDSSNIKPHIIQDSIADTVITPKQAQSKKIIYQKKGGKGKMVRKRKSLMATNN